MLVYRDDRSGNDEDLYQVLDIELVKKPGKGLGLTLMGRKNKPGVFVSEIVSKLDDFFLIKASNRIVHLLTKIPIVGHV